MSQCDKCKKEFSKRLPLAPKVDGVSCIRSIITIPYNQNALCNQCYSNLMDVIEKWWKEKDK